MAYCSVKRNSVRWTVIPKGTDRDHPSSNHIVYLVCGTEPAFGPGEHVRLGGGYVRSTGQFDPSVFSVVVPLGHGGQVPFGRSKLDNVGKPQNVPGTGQEIHAETCDAWWRNHVPLQQ